MAGVTGCSAPMSQSKHQPQNGPGGPLLSGDIILTVGGRKSMGIAQGVSTVKETPIERCWHWFMRDCEDWQGCDGRDDGCYHFTSGLVIKP